MYYILLILVIFVFLLIYNINIINVETLDGNKFLIQNENNDELNNQKINLLNNIINKIFKLKKYLLNNIHNFPEYKSYILQLDKNFNKNITKIYETHPKSKNTSYSVNKGEEVSICMKSKLNHQNHEINLLMYVMIHEMAHFACPEIGHGDLFKFIFKKFLEEAVNIGIYNKEDYSKNPTEYCGMIINSSILY